MWCMCELMLCTVCVRSPVTAWWDVLGDLRNNTVTHAQGIQLTNEDRSFVKRVLKGIDAHEGEKWLVWLLISIGRF